MRTEEATTLSLSRVMAIRGRGLGLIAVMIVLLAIGAVSVNGFATATNVVRIVQSQSYVGLTAVGMMFVVLSRNYVDLSVPALIAVSANTVLMLFAAGEPALALALALGLPLIVGTVNGLLVVKLRLNPVITTLATGTVTAGLLYAATNGAFESAPGSAFLGLGSARVFGLPMVVIAFGVILVLSGVILDRTRFGAYVRFIGANPDAARVMGLPTSTVIVACFLVSSLTAGVTGLFLAAQGNAANLVTGQGYDFDSLAAVVIGGTALRGGIGSAWGTLAGVLVIGVANNLLFLIGLNASAQLLVKGVIFILVVGIDAVSLRGA